MQAACELTDAILFSLLDGSWNVLDLSACGHLQQSSVLKATQPVAQLRMLNLSGRRFTSHNINYEPITNTTFLATSHSLPPDTSTYLLNTTQTWPAGPAGINTAQGAASPG